MRLKVTELGKEVFVSGKKKAYHFNKNALELYLAIQMAILTI